MQAQILEDHVKVGILVFDQVQELDFCGPLEVLSAAGRLKADNSSGNTSTGATWVFTIAETERIITARSGLKIQPH